LHATSRFTAANPGGNGTHAAGDPDHDKRIEGKAVAIVHATNVLIRSALLELHPFRRGPSVDPKLMIRMLIVGYCMGIRSERRLCDEVRLNLAYRWFL
jgi:transposase-like protein DUF772